MVKPERIGPERTEEDKVLQIGVEVTLGGKKYRIDPLPIKHSRPWCRKLFELLKGPLQASRVSADDPEAFWEALKSVKVGSVDSRIDLFFEYARDLNRPEIEEAATSAEIMAAFDAVLTLETPFLETESLAKAVTAVLR